jgi:hypothetical protein
MKHNGNPPREVQQLIDRLNDRAKQFDGPTEWYAGYASGLRYGADELSALLTAAGSSAPSDARLFVEEIGEGRITVGGRIWIPLEVAEARKRP